MCFQGRARIFLRSARNPQRLLRATVSKRFSAAREALPPKPVVKNLDGAFVPFGFRPAGVFAAGLPRNHIWLSMHPPPTIGLVAGRS